MRWAIEGCDRENGKDIQVVIDATTAEEARVKASKRGILVAECKPAKISVVSITDNVISPSTGTPHTPLPAHGSSNVDFARSAIKPTIASVRTVINKTLPELAVTVSSTLNNSDAVSPGDVNQSDTPWRLRHKKVVVIISATIASLSIVGVFIYIFCLRNSWENQQRDRLVALHAEATVLIQNNQLNDGCGKYTELLAIVRDHKVNDPTLRNIIDDSRSALDKVKSRVAANDQEQQTNERKRKRDERSNRNKVAFIQFLSDCKPFIDACANYNMKFDQCMNTTSSNPDKLLALQTALEDSAHSLFEPAKVVDAAYAKIPLDLQDSIDIARSTGDVMQAASQDVLGVKRNFFKICMDHLHRQMNSAAGRHDFDVDANQVDEDYSNALKTLHQASLAAEGIRTNMHLFVDDAGTSNSEPKANDAKTLGSQNSGVMPSTPNSSKQPHSTVQTQLNTAPGSVGISTTAINLLTKLDPETATITGKWAITDGALANSANGFAILELPYHPPAEYDFTTVFKIQNENDGIQMICCGNGHQFSWVVGTPSCGFSFVNGKNAVSNSTTNKGIHITLAKDHTTTVKVRRDGIEGYLDGQLVSALKTDFTDLSLHKSHRMRHTNTIGICASSETVEFRSVEVIVVNAEN
jgi:hypothetical protein